MPNAFQILLFKNDIFGKSFYTFNLLSNDVFSLINAHHNFNTFSFASSFTLNALWENIILRWMSNTYQNSLQIYSRLNTPFDHNCHYSVQPTICDCVLSISFRRVPSNKFVNVQKVLRYFYGHFYRSQKNCNIFPTKLWFPTKYYNSKTASVIGISRKCKWYKYKCELSDKYLNLVYNIK